MVSQGRVTALGGLERSDSRGARFDPVLVWAGTAGLAWLVAYAILTAAGQHSTALGDFVGDVLYLLPIVVATALSVCAALRTRGRIRIAWRLLVVSNALWFAGELAWTLYAYLTPSGAPIPSVADVGYLLQYVVALPAILIGLGVGVLGRARGLLDALLVAAAVAAIGWQVMIGPLVPGSWNAAAITTFIYPVFSVTIVSVLIGVIFSGRRRVPRSMILAGAAYGVAAVSDAGYAYVVVLKSWSDSSWLNLGWQAEAVLLCLAALVAARTAEGGGERPRLDRDMAVLPGLVSFLAVCGLAVTDLVRWGELGNVTFAVTMLLFVGLLLRQFIATYDRTRLARQLRTAATTDSLTGLRNRRFFDERLQIEADLAVRRGTPLSLVLMDLDHFKDVNDTYGHSVGDAVLVTAAERLRRALRATDVIARYGGEEFVFLLPGAGEEEATALAERARKALSQTPVPILDRADPVMLTGSLGVATIESRRYDRPIDVDKLVNAADKALYLAKAHGRDRVVGSARFTELDLDPEREIPSELVWLADQIDDAVGDREHAAAVSRWSMQTSARIGLDHPAQLRVAAAGRLHDIGKISICQDLLRKPNRLNAQEWAEIHRHPDESARLVVELASRPDLAPLVAAHHERYDGTGYPRGLTGANIPVEARIISVCDAWATMRTNRSYARALTTTEAREELIIGKGSQFDPAVVDAFLALVDEGAIDEPRPLRARTATDNAAAGRADAYTVLPPPNAGVPQR